MSKFFFNPNVKIVKSCEEKPSLKAKAEQSPVVCLDIAIPADENFLNNVDEKIFYVDGSIEIKAQDSTVDDSEVGNDEEAEAKNDEKNEALDSSLSCFEHSPLPLREQISLPLQDSDSLYFYEFFIISQHTSNDGRSNRLIPQHEEINEIGSACIMVEKIDDENVMVYITVQMLDGDVNITQEVLSVVNLNLQLVHEKRIERSCVNGRFMEKSLLILADDVKGFRLIKTETTDKETEEWKCDFKWTESGDLISCGANVLLTRRLVLDKFEGCVNSWTCDMKGDIVLSQQTFLKPEDVILHDQPTRIQRVNRLLIPSNGNVIKFSSFFHSPSSCLIKEISSVNFHTTHLSPSSKFPPRTCIKDLLFNWETDLQMLSMYLDEKEQQFDHPRMKMIFRDYILCLMKSKPKSVMNFTMDFMRKIEREANVQQVYQTADRNHQHNSN